jgi:hypothetical protein
LKYGYYENKKNNTIIEFSEKSINKAMGMARFKIPTQMQNAIKKMLPDAGGLVTNL